uniref:B box-type domain-containing protein n=1 Tax=Strongyloides papillosus TaxID=174720 RepID=A0A0N5B6S3_STREA
MCCEVFTQENRSFLYLSCEEVLCYSCCGLDTVDANLIIDNCPNCGKEEVKITDLSRSVDNKTLEILSGPQKILKSIPFDKILENAEFKAEQLAVAIKGGREKKEKYISATKVMEKCEDYILKQKAYIKMLKEREHQKRMKLRHLYEKNRSLMDKLDRT